MMYLTKKELRQHIRQLKRGYSEQELTALSQPIIDKVLDNPMVREAKTVLTYYSLPDEVFTHEMADRLVAMGKEVMLPKVVSDTEMTLHPYTSPQDLSKGSYGIMEPNTPTVKNCDISVAIIPGLAYDKKGHRLGRGKGYYDRFLSNNDTYTIGLCFPFQLVNEVPHDKYDIMMNEVIF